MGLVDYLSDDSDDNGVDTTAKAHDTLPNKAKPSFQKVVDKSNPHKIRVSLPESAVKSASASERHDSEPEPKRIKLGSGGLRGINALLPAPKRTTTSAATSASSGQSGRGRGRGLAPGINLKTGAEPAFSREPMDFPKATDVNETATTASAVPESSHAANILPTQPSPMLSTSKPTRFMPLSVSRKPKPKPKPKFQVRKPSTEAPLSMSHASAAGTGLADGSVAKGGDEKQESVRKAPKISLFSTEFSDIVPDSNAHDSNTVYEPLLYRTSTSETVTPAATLSDTVPGNSGLPSGAEAPGAQNAQSLDSIAADLNLTASERRQLFGRMGAKQGAANSSSAVSVTNFNTDAEYAANEELRAAGEAPDQQHRAVRTVNTAGKNSLRSLVNVVSTQGDALEEHFAKGRRNKQDAGNKYGW